MISKLKWFFIGLLSIFLAYLAGFCPKCVDTLYFKGIFQFIRVIYDYTVGWLPFGSVYLLFVFLVWFIGAKTRAWYLKDRQLSSALVGIANFAGAVIFLFYFLWGFNYKKTSVEKYLGLQVENPSYVQIQDELTLLTEAMHAERANITNDTMALSVAHVPKNMEIKIRESLEKTLAQLEYPNWGKVRVRKLRPMGILLRISTAGVYIPFAIEGHIDGGLHHTAWPATMAHEMSHGYGFTDEGTCNFWSYLTCMNSDDAFIRYSGLYGYWRYVASTMRQLDPAYYDQWYRDLPSGIRNDAIERRQYLDRFPDIMPRMRDQIYDSYLKSQGIKEGLASYERVILLKQAWDRKQGFNLKPQIQK